MPHGNWLHRGVQIIAAATLLLFCSIADHTTPIQSIDNVWLDVLTRERAATRAAPDDIVLIDIDDASLFALANTLGNWPWPRAAHGELVEWLQTQNVKKIVFDIWFSEPDIFNPSSDAYLGEVIDRYNNIYLPTLELANSGSPATPLISTYPNSFLLTPTASANANARALFFKPILGSPEKWKLGSINYLVDRDGIARRYDIVRLIDGWRFWSLPARVLLDEKIELPNQKTFVLDWYNHFDNAFNVLSYSDLYTAAQNGDEMPALNGKTVFIGSTASGIDDFKPTPLSAQYSGFFMLATAYANLRSGDTLHYLSVWNVLPLGVLPLLLIMLLHNPSYRQRARYPMATAVSIFVMAIGAAFAASYYLIGQAQLLPVLSMTLLASAIFTAGLAMQYLSERRSRQQAIAVFSRFLDARVVANLTANGLTPATLEPKQVELTILFSDIRGFTTLSETRAPAEIMALLNDYFSRQVALIFKHHGTLDKFIGDAIMAFWGAPINDPEHAANAVAAALEMSHALDEFKRERQLPDFDIGIGVHTGPAVVGMLGSEQRLEYTAIGDTINLGSRLEGLTKDKARILVSESTALACANRFIFREIGSFQVKGRNEAVRVYEPLRRKDAS